MSRKRAKKAPAAAATESTAAGADRPGPEAAAGGASAGDTDPAAGDPAAAAAGAGATGPELARAALEAALARQPQQPRRRSGTARRTAPDRARGGTWSGPAADPRDPQPFQAVLAKLMKARGWERPAAEATLFGQWEQVVGAEVADHCRPVKLEGGELTLEATSTAWATQLRLLAASLVRKIAVEVGHNVVTSLRIHGPAAPSWNRGPRRVRGRGPRDTYG